MDPESIRLMGNVATASKKRSAPGWHQVPISINRQISPPHEPLEAFMQATRNIPLLPDVQPVRITGVRGRAERTLYRQPGICVTPEWFIVAGRRFPIRELTHLQTARGARDRLTVRAVGATGVALAGIAATLGFARGLDELSAGVYLTLIVAAFVPLLLAWLGDRFRPRSFELWGRYRGLMVLLFSSDEERQYGQVSRALLRARETSRLGGMADPVATMQPWVPDRR